MRVGVLGAGAVGAWVGGRLLTTAASSGTSNLEIVLVGRRESVGKQLKENGLRVSDLRGNDDTFHSGFTYSTDPRSLEGCDYVLVAVKATSTALLASVLADLDWGLNRPTIVSLQNGVGNAKLLRKHLPNHRVLASVVVFNVVRMTDTHLHCASDGALMVEADVYAGTHVPLCNLLNKCLPLTIEENILPKQYAKLLLNLGNAVNALSGIPIKEMLENHLLRCIIADMMEEAHMALTASSIEVVAIDRVKQPWLIPHLLRMPNSLFLIIARKMLDVDPLAKSSMSQDLERKHETEIDFLQGEIIRAGRKVQFSTPINSAIYKLILDQQTARKGSPGFSPEVLNKLVRGGRPKPSLFSNPVMGVFLCLAIILYSLISFFLF